MEVNDKVSYLHEGNNVSEISVKFRLSGVDFNASYVLALSDTLFILRVNVLLLYFMWGATLYLSQYNVNVQVHNRNKCRLAHLFSDLSPDFFV